jgi:hypothetical protein
VPGPDAAERSDLALVQQLTVVGWLLLGGQFGFILFQFERVRTVDGTRFATAWDQRIEVLSFLILPPNLMVLFPAAAVAIGTTWLAGSTQRGAWLDSLPASQFRWSSSDSPRSSKSPHALVNSSWTRSSFGSEVCRSPPASLWAADWLISSESKSVQSPSSPLRKWLRQSNS